MCPGSADALAVPRLSFFWFEDGAFEMSDRGEVNIIALPNLDRTLAGLFHATSGDDVVPGREVPNSGYLPIPDAEMSRRCLN
jgi:hypothetical protein